MTVDRGAADPEGLGDLGGALAALAACSGGGELVGVHHDRAAAAAALCPCCEEAGHGALVDDVALQFGEGGHHGEEELAFAGRGVGAGQLAGQDADADAALVQVVGDGQYVLDGAAEPVEFPDDEGVAGAQVVERGAQAGPVSGGLPGAGLFFVDPAASGGAEVVALQLGVLAVR